MDTFIEIPASVYSLSTRQLRYGVGVNDAPYIVKPVINGKVITCPFYQVWSDMLVRCYNPKRLAKQPTYIGCTVAKEWHSFMSFKQWMKTQDWVDKALDKDILFEGNKIYSPETCVFVDNKLNSFLTFGNSIRGKYPLGVDQHKNSNRFRASCRNGTGKQIPLGTFDTIEEAHKVYCNFKANVFKELANQQTDLRLKNALLRRAETIHLVA